MRGLREMGVKIRVVFLIDGKGNDEIDLDW